jgi:ribonuclease BN (tRNA processing enzyme)
MRLGLLAAVSAVSLGCAHAEPALPAAAAPSADACTRRAPSSSPFELAVLGSGGPASFGRAASGYVVFLDGVARALVDVGPGAFVRLGEMGVDLRRLDTFLVTHLHIDHSGDVPGVVMSRDLSFDEPLLFRFFGPRGGGDYPSTTAFIARLFGAQGAFPYLAKFRNTLKLDAVDLPTAEDAPIQEVLRDDDLHVTSWPSTTATPRPSRSASSTRDTSSSCRAISPRRTTTSSTSPREPTSSSTTRPSSIPPAPPRFCTTCTPRRKRIGEVAAQAHVKSLLLSHITPAVERSADAVLRSVHASYKGPARLASDCLRVDVAER